MCSLEILMCHRVACFDEHYVNEYTHSWSFSMTGKKIFGKTKILLLFGKDILKLETVLSFQDKNLCVVFKFKPHRIIETFFSTSLNLRFYNVKTGSCKLSILYQQDIPKYYNTAGIYTHREAVGLDWRAHTTTLFFALKLESIIIRFGFIFLDEKIDEIN